MIEAWRKKDKSEDFTNRLVTLLDPISAAAEAYRTLRTNLLYALVDDPPKVIVLTSSVPQEGKSTTCANLGIVLSQAEQRTLILDCDLHKPTMHKFFEIPNLYGMVDVLAGQRSLQETWKEPVPGLNLVPTGPIPPNPNDLLGSRRFAELLTEVREDFDYVLVDAPPVGAVSDAALVAVRGDGILIVVDAQKTRKGALRQSTRSLKTVGANVLGAVMTNVKANKGDYYYSYGYE